jgi:hypothetical protein
MAAALDEQCAQIRTGLDYYGDELVFGVSQFTLETRFFKTVRDGRCRRNHL